MESSSLKIQRLNWWSSNRLRLEPKLKFPLIFYPHILPEEIWFSPIVRSELMVPEHHLRNPKLEWPIDLEYAVRMHPRDKCWIAPIPFNRKMFVFMDIRPNNDFILLRVHFLQLILIRTLPPTQIQNSFLLSQTDLGINNGWLNFWWKWAFWKYSTFKTWL